VDRYIPDRGVDDAVAGAAGKTDQAGQAGIVSPKPHPQQAVLQCPTDPAQGAPTPADGITKALQFEQIDVPFAAERELKLGVWVRAKAIALAVQIQKQVPIQLKAAGLGVVAGRRAITVDARLVGNHGVSG
jgi:hypothetical protein